jgi:hypothetical protein
MSERPSDIILPEGWTWERVEEQRAKWGIADNMVPIAVVPGACVAWGTINGVRLLRLEELISAYLAAKTLDEAGRLAVEVECYADEIGYDDHTRLKAVHTASEKHFAIMDEIAAMERAADGNSYRYHATGLPAGGDRNAQVAEPLRSIINSFSAWVIR